MLQEIFILFYIYFISEGSIYWNNIKWMLKAFILFSFISCRCEDGLTGLPTALIALSVKVEKRLNIFF